MRRRDFLKGLAVALGAVGLPVAAAPRHRLREVPNTERVDVGAFDFSWHTITTSKQDFTESVNHLATHLGTSDLEKIGVNLVVNEHGQIEARLA